MEKGKEFKWTVFAFDDVGAPVTGIAATITAELRSDNATSGTSTTDTNPTEVGDGYYDFTITATEASKTNYLTLFPETTDSGTTIIATPKTFSILPLNFNYTGIESSGNISEVDLVGITTLNSDTATKVASELATYDAATGTDVSTAQTAIQIDIANLDNVVDTVKTDTEAIIVDIADVPTVAEFEARTLVAADYTIVGDEMNLVDNAITSAKYDESTAFPLKSDDTGATAVARTGADGDTLETLSDQVDLQATLAINSEARLSELDAANLPTDISDVKTDTAAIKVVTDALNQPLTSVQTIAIVDQGFITYDAAKRTDVTTAQSAIQADIATLDAVVDTVKTDTEAIIVDIADVPTVAEFEARTLAAADYTIVGDEMNLVDDAITSAKYDESTAFPLKADDSGATLVARSGADGDTLNDLSDEIALVAPGVWTEASARTDDFGTLLEQLADWHFNKKTVVDSTGAVTLRDKGDSGDLATWGITDNSTLTVSTEVAWV